MAADFDLWAAIAAEREALAGDLAALTDDQWRTPSLCEDWTVEQVLGHMTATAEKTAGGFFASILKSGFNFTKMANADIAERTTGGPKATLAGFRSVVTSRRHPPGPTTTWLGETIVHAEDIRRPLHLAHTYDPIALREVADFYKGSNLIIGAKKRIDGLRLQAADQDWSHGSGPDVQGPLIALVLAMTGRRAALDDLSGEGVAALRGRP
jgi:uncharacterized protein (TIGR03083 family)